MNDESAAKLTAAINDLAAAIRSETRAMTGRSEESDEPKKPGKRIEKQGERALYKQEHVSPFGSHVTWLEVLITDRNGDLANILFKAKDEYVDDQEVWVPYELLKPFTESASDAPSAEELSKRLGLD